MKFYVTFPGLLASVLGYDTGAALVELSINDVDFTLTADHASKLALMLLEVAAGSRSDKAIFDTMTEGGVPLGDITEFVLSLRHAREKRS